MNPFLNEHKKVLLLLIKHQVDFILIGGFAVIYHGYERTTGDMDLWLKPDNENRDRFMDALAEQGISTENLSIVKGMDFSIAQVMHIGEKPNKIDFLTQ